MEVVDSNKEVIKESSEGRSRTVDRERMFGKRCCVYPLHKFDLETDMVEKGSRVRFWVVKMITSILVWVREIPIFQRLIDKRRNYSSESRVSVRDNGIRDRY